MNGGLIMVNFSIFNFNYDRGRPLCAGHCTKSKIARNEKWKKNIWVLVFQKYGKFWSLWSLWSFSSSTISEIVRCTVALYFLFTKQYLLSRRHCHYCYLDVHSKIDTTLSPTNLAKNEIYPKKLYVSSKTLTLLKYFSVNL